MRVISIPVFDCITAVDHIHHANKTADGIELRLDYLDYFELNEIRKIREHCDIPVIFTLRKKEHGGLFAQPEQDRLDLIKSLALLQPDYFDIEFDTSIEFVKILKNDFPSLRLICSYHNFHETPQELDIILQQMSDPVFDSYKIATFARDTIDALRMLDFVKSNASHCKLTGIGMGELGQCTRILGPVVGSYMHYTALADPLLQKRSTASGQLSLDELESVYHFSKLNQDTKIFALLGDPVEQSVGHLLHNQAIRFLKQNAVYVKFKLTNTQLSEAFSLIRKLNVAGLSITMPHKENSLLFLDEAKSETESIKAVNTVINLQQRYIGYNTDGTGAMQALARHRDLANQTIIILGAGGAARAIAYAARKLHANVIFVNRTLSKAIELAQEFGCIADTLDNLKKYSFSVIINTLPELAFSASNFSLPLTPATIAMDIVYQPILTSFLLAARKAGCILIPGYFMYINQALLQIKHWFNPESHLLKEIQSQMMLFFNSERGQT